MTWALILAVLVWLAAAGCVTLALCRAAARADAKPDAPRRRGPWG